MRGWTNLPCLPPRPDVETCENVLLFLSSVGDPYCVFRQVIPRRGRHGYSAGGGREFINSPRYSNKRMLSLPMTSLSTKRKALLSVLGEGTSGHSCMKIDLDSRTTTSWRRDTGRAVDRIVQPCPKCIPAIEGYGHTSGMHLTSAGRLQQTSYNRVRPRRG